MTTHNVWAIVLAGAFLFAASAGCGDEEPNPFILAFDQPEVTITKNTAFTLTVKLSERVGKKTHVEVTNKHDTFVGVDPIVLLFKAGDEFSPGADRQVTTITGRKSTNNTFRELIFTIRESPNEIRSWSVKVRDN